VAISDTHNLHEQIKIPWCDLFIHAGDCSILGSEKEMRSFAKWLNEQDAKYKIFVPGNHEFQFEKSLPLSFAWIKEECPSVHLLIDQMVDIEGIKIWGSPYTPFFNNWAFNEFRGDNIKRHWDLIPNNIDILITHGPPLSVLDQTLQNERVGCEDLFNKVQELKPKLHIFGHIHYEGSRQLHFNDVSYYNVAICDEMYVPINPITVIDFE